MIAVESIAASAVVLRNTGAETEMLLLKRTKEDGNFWCHVAGGIEADETAWQTVVREIGEETGLTVRQLYTSEYIEQFYEAHRDRIMLVPLFVARVDASADVVLNDEHSDFCWCTLAEAKKRAPFVGQHRAYDHVWQYFVEQTPHPILNIELPAQGEWGAVL